MTRETGPAERATVFLVGSLNADVSYGVSSLPAPGETVVAHSAQSSPGGKGANQAIAAAAAGAPTRMVGAVGDDREGGPLTQALAARGVETRDVARRPGVDTGRAVVLVDGDGENSIVVLAGANAGLDDATVIDGLADIVSGDVLVLQNEVPAEANRTAARVARHAGASVIWNAAPAPAGVSDVIEDVDLLVVNEGELARLASLLGVASTATETADDAPSARDGIVELLTGVVDALGGRASRPGHAIEAVCTLGPDGAVLVSGGASHKVASPRVTAVDTTAAGDTVVGYLAALSRLPLLERVRVASAAGALAVTRPGASTSIPTIDEVGDFRNEVAATAAPTSPTTPTERTTA